MADLPCPRCDGWMAREGERWRCPACGLESEDEPLGTQGLAPGVAAPDVGEVGRAGAAPEPAVGQGLPARAEPADATPRPAQGKPRSFGIGLLLGVVTLGFYFLYWQWTVFAELRRQAGGRHRAALFLLALAAGVAQAVWRLALPGGPAGLPGGLGADLVGTLLSLAAGTLSTAYLVLEGRALDHELRQAGRAPAAATGPLVASLALVAAAWLAQLASMGLFLLLVGVAVLVDLVAFHALQDGLNRFWGGVRAGSAPPTALTPAPS